MYSSYILCCFVHAIVGTVTPTSFSDRSTNVVSQILVNGQGFLEEYYLRILHRNQQCEDFLDTSVDTQIQLGCPDGCAYVDTASASDSAISLYPVSSETMGCDGRYLNCVACQITSVFAVNSTVAEVVFSTDIVSSIYVGDVLAIDPLCTTFPANVCVLLLSTAVLEIVSNRTIFIAVELGQFSSGVSSLDWRLTNRLSTMVEIVRTSEALSLTVCFVGFTSVLAGTVSFLEPPALERVSLVLRSLVANTIVPSSLSFDLASSSDLIQLVFTQLNYFNLYLPFSASTPWSIPGSIPCSSILTYISVQPQNCSIGSDYLQIQTTERVTALTVSFRVSVASSADVFTEYLQIQCFDSSRPNIVSALGRVKLMAMPVPLAGILEPKFAVPGGLSVLPNSNGTLLSIVIAGSNIVGGTGLTIWVPIPNVSLESVVCAPTSGTLITFPSTVCGPMVGSSRDSFVNLILPPGMSTIGNSIFMNITMKFGRQNYFSWSSGISAQLTNPTSGHVDYAESVGSLLLGSLENIGANLLSNNSYVLAGSVNNCATLQVLLPAPIWMNGYLRIVAPLGTLLQGPNCVLNSCVWSMGGSQVLVGSVEIGLRFNAPATSNSSAWQIQASQNTDVTNLFDFNSSLVVATNLTNVWAELENPFWDQTGKIFVFFENFFSDVSFIVLQFTNSALPVYCRVEGLVAGCASDSGSTLQLSLPRPLSVGNYSFAIPQVRNPSSGSGSVSIQLKNSIGVVVAASEALALLVGWKANSVPPVVVDAQWTANNSLGINLTANVSVILPAGLVWSSDFTTIIAISETFFPRITLTADDINYWLVLLPNPFGLSNPVLSYSNNCLAQLNTVAIGFTYYPANNASCVLTNSISTWPVITNDSVTVQNEQLGESDWFVNCGSYSLFLGSYIVNSQMSNFTIISVSPVWPGIVSNIQFSFTLSFTHGKALNGSDMDYLMILEYNGEGGQISCLGLALLNDWPVGSRATSCLLTGDTRMAITVNSGAGFVAGIAYCFSQTATVFGGSWTLQFSNESSISIASFALAQVLIESVRFSDPVLGTKLSIQFSLTTAAGVEAIRITGSDDFNTDPSLCMFGGNGALKSLDYHCEIFSNYVEIQFSPFTPILESGVVYTLTIGLSVDWISFCMTTRNATVIDQSLIFSTPKLVPYFFSIFKNGLLSVRLGLKFLYGESLQILASNGTLTLLSVVPIVPANVELVFPLTELLSFSVLHFSAEQILLEASTVFQSYALPSASLSVTLSNANVTILLVPVEMTLFDSATISVDQSGVDLSQCVVTNNLEEGVGLNFIGPNILVVRFDSYWNEQISLTLSNVVITGSSEFVPFTNWTVVLTYLQTAVLTIVANGFSIPAQLNVTVAILESDPRLGDSVTLQFTNVPLGAEVLWPGVVNLTQQSLDMYTLVLPLNGLGTLIVNLWQNNTLIGQYDNAFGLNAELCSPLLGLTISATTTVVPSSVILVTVAASFTSEMDEYLLVQAPEGFSWSSEIACPIPTTSMSCTRMEVSSLTESIMVPKSTPIVNVWTVFAFTNNVLSHWSTVVAGFEISQLSDALAVYNAASGMRGLLVAGFTMLGVMDRVRISLPAASFEVGGGSASWWNLISNGTTEDNGVCDFLLNGSSSVHSFGVSIPLILSPIRNIPNTSISIELMSGTVVTAAIYILPVAPVVYGFSIYGSLVIHFRDDQSAMLTSWTNLTSTDYTIIETSQIRSYREEFHLTLLGPVRNPYIAKLVISFPANVEINFAYTKLDPIFLGISLNKTSSYFLSSTIGNSSVELVLKNISQLVGSFVLSVPVTLPANIESVGFNYFQVSFCASNGTQIVTVPFVGHLLDNNQTPESKGAFIIATGWVAWLLFFL